MTQQTPFEHIVAELQKAKQANLIESIFYCYENKDSANRINVRFNPAVPYKNLTRLVTYFRTKYDPTDLIHVSLNPDAEHYLILYVKHNPFSAEAIAAWNSSQNVVDNLL